MAFVKGSFRCVCVCVCVLTGGLSREGAAFEAEPLGGEGDRQDGKTGGTGRGATRGTTGGTDPFQGRSVETLLKLAGRSHQPG